MIAIQSRFYYFFERVPVEGGRSMFFSDVDSKGRRGEKVLPLPWEQPDETNALLFEEALRSCSSAQSWSVLEGLFPTPTSEWTEVVFFLLLLAATGQGQHGGTLTYFSHRRPPPVANEVWTFPWLCRAQVCSWRESTSSASQHEEGSPLALARAGD